MREDNEKYLTTFNFSCFMVLMKTLFYQKFMPHSRLSAWMLYKIYEINNFK